MKPFLKLFGVEYGNGCDPMKLIKDFFYPPERYPRDNTKDNYASGGNMMVTNRLLMISHLVILYQALW